MGVKLQELEEARPDLSRLSLVDLSPQAPEFLHIRYLQGSMTLDEMCPTN